MTPRAAKQRALLALLLLRANEPVAADQLVEQLWDGKPPATALNTLQHYVSELRKLFSADTLVTQPPGYVLRVEPEQIDLCRFERAAEKGRQALEQEDAAQASDLLEQALALWRGAALADFAYESWAVQEAQRLEELRLDVVENRVEARLALGRHGELVAELQNLVAQQPLRERLRRQLMLVLYRSGRQAEALEAYQQARETLVEELGIDPSPELQALYKQILNQDETLAPPARAAEQPRTNLPEPPTPLIGRRRELEELRELLSRPDARLVTFTGAGGSGKTRLALELAHKLVPEFRDGVFLVELAPITDPELLAPTIAHALELREQPGEPLEQTLAHYLRERELLLLLDNFEQLLGAAPRLAALLTYTHRLRVLVTSRAAIHVAAEHEYPLQPLSLPDLGQLPDLAGLAQCEAVALFIERARAVRPDFEVTNANAPAVAEICTRIDGLPLAIELAAARIRALTPEAMLSRLGQRLSLLTGGARDLPERQQTLRAAIEWSHNLLDEEEQHLLARLAVFVGGARIESAEDICGAGLDALESLVDKSLLRQERDPDGEPRYEMLETIREYALERLSESSEADAVRRRHAEHFLALAEQAELESRSTDQWGWFERLDADNPNLRAAIDRARENGESDLVLRFATSLWRFWSARGYVAEGKDVLEEALALTEERPARTVLGLCTLRLLAGSNAETVLPDAEEALRASEQLRDDFSLAQAWNLLGKLQGSLLGAFGPAEHAWTQALSYAERGDYAAEKAESIWGLLLTAVAGPLPAGQGIVRCKELFDVAGDNPEVRAFCQAAQAALEAMRAEFSVARRLLAEGTRAFEELGLFVWAANNAQLTFTVEMLAGDPKAASTALRESYESLAEMGERGFLSSIAALLAHALYAQGEYDEAERFSRLSEDAAATDDVWSQLLWRSVRAKLWARRGQPEAAERMAREAVDLAEQTDLLNAQGDVLLDLSEVLTLARRTNEARLHAGEAAQRYEKKENLPSLERARRAANGLALARRHAASLQ